MPPDLVHGIKSGDSDEEALKVSVFSSYDTEQRGDGRRFHIRGTFDTEPRTASVSVNVKMFNSISWFKTSHLPAFHWNVNTEAQFVCFFCSELYILITVLVSLHANFPPKKFRLSLFCWSTSSILYWAPPMTAVIRNLGLFSVRLKKDFYLLETQVCVQFFTWGDLCGWGDVSHILINKGIEENCWSLVTKAVISKAAFFHLTYLNEHDCICICLSTCFYKVTILFFFWRRVFLQRISCGATHWFKQSNSD